MRKFLTFKQNLDQISLIRLTKVSRDSRLLLTSESVVDESSLCALVQKKTCFFRYNPIIGMADHLKTKERIFRNVIVEHCCQPMTA